MSNRHPLSSGSSIILKHFKELSGSTDSHDRDAVNSGRLVTTGDVISKDTGFMRGHGTYVEGESLIASVGGFVERVNKLITVQSVVPRYVGKVGDVVIGRVTGLGLKRWKIELNSSLGAVLLLSAVNLPHGELRRRSEEDERLMRTYLSEGDLISAEVQQVYADGMLSLHTRSLKYGKLGQGSLVIVSPSLIKQQKNHFHNLACGATIILGNNGYVWICPLPSDNKEETGGFKVDLNPIDKRDCEVIARLRNCVVVLTHHKMSLYYTSILYAYEASLQHATKDILMPDVAAEIVQTTRHNIQQGVS